MNSGDLVQEHVIARVTNLVRDILEQCPGMGDIELDLINNIPDEGPDMLHWWLVTDWLYWKLLHIGETTILSNYGSMWGMVPEGRALSMNHAIQRIAKEEK